MSWLRLDPQAKFSSFDANLTFDPLCQHHLSSIFRPYLRPLPEIRVVCAKVGDAGSGGGLNLAETITELNPSVDLGKAVLAVEFSPFLLRRPLPPSHTCCASRLTGNGWPVSGPFHSTLLETEQHLAPALHAFAQAVTHRQQLLAATIIHCPAGHVYMHEGGRQRPPEHIVFPKLFAA